MLSIDGAENSQMKKPVIPLIVIIAAAALGLWYFLAHRKPPAVPTPAPSVSAVPPAPAPPTLPATRFPVPAESGGAKQVALPALADSDPAIRGALTGLIGAAAVQQFLAPEDLIRRIVVTVDNLPRRKVPVDKRPVVAVPGAFLAQGDEQHATLDQRNFARYAPVVDVVRNLDMQALANLYFHFYPLFQSAYQNLGYPEGYFNDRLIAVIDELLATPQPRQPIALVQPNVMYEFADPALEALPAGQKLLIRMGPQNAAVIKGKLAELRAALTAAPPPH